MVSVITRRSSAWRREVSPAAAASLTSRSRSHCTVDSTRLSRVASIMKACRVSAWPATSLTSPNGLPEVTTTRPSVTTAVVAPCSAARGTGRRSPPQTSTASGRKDSEIVRPGPNTSQSTASETSSTGTASMRCRRFTISLCPRMASPVPAMMMMAAPLRSTQPSAVWPVTGMSPTARPAMPMTPLATVATAAARANRPTSPSRRIGAAPPPCHSTGSADERAVSQE